MEPPGKIQKRNFSKSMEEAGELVVSGRSHALMHLNSAPDIWKANQLDLPNIAGRHSPQPSFMEV